MLKGFGLPFLPLDPDEEGGFSVVVSEIERSDDLGPPTGFL